MLIRTKFVKAHAKLPILAAYPYLIAGGGNLRLRRPPREYLSEYSSREKP